MDNTNEDFNVEQETVEVEETTTEEATEETQEADTVVISKEKFKAMQKKAIAYDASKKVPQKENITNNTLSREEAILIAKGRSEEDLDLLHTIAKGKGISLLDAEKHALFTAYEEKKAEELKKEQARPGASKGSGSAKSSTGFTNPGLSAEEHKKLWKEIMGK